MDNILNGVRKFQDRIVLHYCPLNFFIWEWVDIILKLGSTIVRYWSDYYVIITIKVAFII